MPIEKLPKNKEEEISELLLQSEKEGNIGIPGSQRNVVKIPENQEEVWKGPEGQTPEDLEKKKEEDPNNLP